MKAEVEIKTERVDDIPLLMWQQRAMGIPGIIDEVIAAHGNRQGLSIGWTVAGWITYILSESDHRLSYVEPWAEAHAEEEGIFAHGHSKDHRPDLAQFKVMLSALDPMALPLSLQVIRGNEADDGLYIPAIEQSRKVLKRKGLLYIGDTKMEALATRAHLAAGDDFYLIPLSRKGSQGDLLEELLGVVEKRPSLLSAVYNNDSAKGESRLVAQAYETLRTQEALVNDEPVAWQERLLIVHSPTLAEQAEQGLAQRLQRAQEKLNALTVPGRGKKQWNEIEPLQEAVTQILQQHRVTDLLQVAYQLHETTRQIRRHLDRPARTEVTQRYTLTVTCNEAALAQLRRTFGWRLFVTNSSQEALPLADAILTYRQAPVAERDFSRLKGIPLGLRPVYLQREDHLVGLVRLLSLALRVLTLVEFLVRQQLLDAQDSLTGLYPGNPTLPTQRPTTERLLRAFQNITLTFIHTCDQSLIHLSPLSPLQSRILALIGLPDSIYTNLTRPSDPIPI